MWPSTLTAFTDPLANNRLNAPDHAAVETAQNTGIEGLQAYIGVNTGASASVVGTLLYDIKAPDSNGGGHIQTANKGGTGQTAFNKGDLLVGQSTSVLSKLTAGQDTYILSTNSTTATGVEWIQNPRVKQAVMGSVLELLGANETSIFSTTVSGSTLGANNALRTTVHFNGISFTGPDTITFKAIYGAGSVATIALVNLTAASPHLDYGILTHDLIARNNPSSQLSVMRFTAGNNRTLTGANPSTIAILSHLNVNANVNSDAPQRFGITAQWDASDGASSVVGVIVEKIT